MLALRDRLYVAPLQWCFAHDITAQRVLVGCIDAAFLLGVAAALALAGYAVGSTTVCPALRTDSAGCWYLAGPAIGVFVLAFCASLVIFWTMLFHNCVAAHCHAVPDDARDAWSIESSSEEEALRATINCPEQK